jgi:DNA-binding MarR family transcriptional regulator
MVALQRAEPMPQRELAQLLNLDKSTVSRLVVDLEERGWIVREKAEHDARVTLLRRTAVGTDKSQAISAARNERLGGLLDHIPYDQRAQIVKAIQVLAEVVQNESVATIA